MSEARVLRCAHKIAVGVIDRPDLRRLSGSDTNCTLITIVSRSAYCAIFTNFPACFQHPVVDCLLSFIAFVAWRCCVDALPEGALALRMSMADNARLKDMDGFVQRQDVTFVKKISPYSVVVDAKDNLTQQPYSFTITAATTIRQLTRWHVASWLLTSVSKRGDLNRHCIFVKPVVRTILCDRVHNQDRQTLHLYSSRSSSSCVNLMVDKMIPFL
ncbi:hypothetical protein T4A_5655 [Trichinella pseudospiralis]|uniref:Uncharacterized protein n=1 Tax=Trichinella pseudospiralis TaxID=6337 RepID=A0A0V1EGK9_TRIPS|nr:hypothetical protein T4A_5655 [Trichinella pseudospiralis]